VTNRQSHLNARALTAPLAVLLILTACGGGGASPTESASAAGSAAASSPSGAASLSDCTAVELKAGHDSSVEHPYQAGLEAFAETLDQETDGQVTVEIFPDAQLGDEASMIEGLSLGTVDLVVTSTPPLSGFSDKIELLSLPFLAEDLDQNYRILDGEVGETLAAELAEPTQAMVLGWYFAGQRNVWNSERPINTPADLEGLKIRTQESPVQIATFNALGAQAVPMSFGELYQALQTGVVDGADNDPVDVLTEKFYEVTKYYSFTGHFFLNSALMLSSETFGELCQAQQDAVMAAAEESVRVERETQEGLVQDAISELEGFGIEFNEVADKAPFKELVQSVYDDFEEQIGADLIQAARDS
jgi:tripartite ATP-independent transporter DctP family solute receptor